MNIQENISLKEYTSMKIGGTAKYFCEVSNEKDLEEINNFAKEKELPLFILGEGSNTIFSDKTHDYIFVLLQNKGIIKTHDARNIINVEVAAGENWDEFVKWTVENNLTGLEALSGIPGNVGAGPIQNIGAYGSEIKEYLTYIKLFDIDSGQFYEMSNKDCDFEYRDSIFKKNIGKFIITNVAFQLSKSDPQIPQYKDVQIYFLAKRQKEATAEEIRDAILEIRSNKLPLPIKVPNSGSFFKNPILEEDRANEIIKRFPKIPFFQCDDGKIKLYAGWLIEDVGLKGKSIGNIRVHKNSALALTNPDGKANFKDLEEAIKHIKGMVKNKFNITLEVEPNIIK